MTDKMDDDTEKLQTTNSFLAKRITLLAIPIALTFLSVVLSKTVVDTIFSSRYDVLVLAAIPVSTMISIVPLAFINGIIYSAVPQYTYLKEQGELEKIHVLLFEYILLTIILVLICYGMVMWLTPIVLTHLKINPAIIPLIKTYLQFLLPYMMGMLLYNNFYYFSESCGIPVLATISVFVSLGLKTLGIYLLVFSDTTQMKLGIAGFGISNVIFSWSKLLLLLVLIFLYQRRYGGLINIAKKTSLSLKRILSHFIKGIPIALNGISDWGAMLTVSLLITSIGVLQAGAHGIAFSLLPLSLVLINGFSRATAIFIARYQDKYHLLRKTAITGIALIVLLLVIICGVLILFQSTILDLYHPKKELLPLLNSLYVLVPLVVIFYGLNDFYAFILRGFSDFKVTFTIFFIKSWVLLIPIGYILSSTDILMPKLGVIGWWYALIIANIIATVMCVIRVHRLIDNRRIQHGD